MYVSARKTTDSVCCQWESFSFQAKTRVFGKLVTATLSSPVSRNLKGISADRGNIKDGDVLMYGETCQYLDLPDSASIFQMTNAKSCKGTPMHFYILDYKNFTDQVSDSTLYLIFKKLPLKSWYRIIRIPKLFEKTIQIYLPFPPNNI